MQYSIKGVQNYIFNPLQHIDPFGTILFPIIGFLTHVPLFGWAKPVPVDERNLKNPKSDMFWIAAAGPLSNIFLACVTAAGLAIFYRVNLESIIHQEEGTVQIADVLKNFVLLNVYLAFFNLIPLHPLDGGKVERALPDEPLEGADGAFGGFRPADPDRL